MLEWQFTHERPNIRLLLVVVIWSLSYSVAGCLDAMWQRWQSIGMRTTSMRSFDEPCGSWHVAQFSRTGACSNSMGPRISVWHVVQSSATELPVFRFLTLLIEPCGLWHELHVSLPSRTGMCATARSVLATWSRWQVAH